jgi:hypothetical protein
MERFAALLAPSAPPGGAVAALAASAPPAWLLLVLAGPHLWYMWVIIHPASTKRTAALLRTDAVEWFAGVSLVLNVAQLASVLAFVAAHPERFWPADLAAGFAAAPWRLLALPAFAFGSVLKVAIFTAIGKKGVYYGAKFGHTIPWVHGFPFNLTGAWRRTRHPHASPVTRLRAAPGRLRAP